jgi:Rrf2 family iron-sulfur cluster assembly transcriptional regulator
MLTLPETARYALRAVSYIAEHEAQGPVPVSVVARALDAPQNYLSKTLYQLGTLGVLRSVRGVRGGYRLGAPAARIRLRAIVEPFLPAQDHLCIMGHERCRDDVPCGAHARWKEVRETARGFFTDLTIADLLTGLTDSPSTRRSALPLPCRSAAAGRSSDPCP